MHIEILINGINPYNSLSTKRNTLAITILNYNLLVEIISKPFQTMLTLLIQEKKEIQDLGIFLEPLIDEFITTWNGVIRVDISRTIGKSV